MNSEMSAPATNALPPAPRMTTARTESLPWKCSRMSPSACAISRLTALRFLKLIEGHPADARFDTGQHFCRSDLEFHVVVLSIRASRLPFRTALA